MLSAKIGGSSTLAEAIEAAATSSMAIIDIFFIRIKLCYIFPYLHLDAKII
jgi:hypothetical protein